MYKLIIVDDEPTSRYGIRDCIQWDKYDIEVIGEADDGTSALEMISKEAPDIIITDVKMKYMDGIELVKKIKENKYSTKIIFISGYGDLDFIKSALKLDAVDYVLKPIDLEELETVIKKVIGMIKEEEAKSRYLDNIERKLNKSMPLLKNEFFYDLITNNYESEIVIQEKMQSLKIDLNLDANYCVIKIKIESGYLPNELEEKDRKRKDASIVNICEELINSYFEGSILKEPIDEYVCILELRDGQTSKDVYEFAAIVRAKLYQDLNMNTTIGIGSVTRGISSLSNSYYKAGNSLKKRTYLGKNRIIIDDDIEAEQGTVHYLPDTIEEKIITFLKAGDKEAIHKLIHSYFEKLYDAKNTYIKYYQFICTHLYHIALKAISELELSIDELYKNENINRDALLKADTLDEMKRIIIDYYEAVIIFIQSKQDDSNNTIIKIKQIIKNKYNHNLTVNDIAKEVFLTSNYISNLFKKETGMTVNDYLTKIRVEESKKMLIDPSKNLYDICFAVGYSDPSYFSKVFKKYTGLTPSQYRRKIQ